MEGHKVTDGKVELVDGLFATKIIPFGFSRKRDIRFSAGVTNTTFNSAT